MLDAMLQQRQLFVRRVLFISAGVHCQNRCPIDQGDTNGMRPGFNTSSEAEQQVTVKGFAFQEPDYGILNDPVSIYCGFIFDRGFHSINRHKTQKRRSG
jgi:hypothetical protein